MTMSYSEWQRVIKRMRVSKIECHYHVSVSSFFSLSGFLTWLKHVELIVTWDLLFGNIMQNKASIFDKEKVVAQFDEKIIAAWQKNSYCGPWRRAYPRGP